MASLIKIVAIIMTSWFVNSSGQRKDVSDNILNFLTIVNGVWFSKPQVGNLVHAHDFITVHLAPVKVPALNPGPILFLEGAVNGTTIIKQVGVVTESNRAIFLKLYDFTDPPNYTPGAYDVNELQNLQPEDFKHTNGCYAGFIPQAGDLFVGNWPACQITVAEKHPRLSMAFTCVSHATSIPLETELTPTLLPYNFTRTGDRYPLIDPPISYISPCNIPY